MRERGRRARCALVGAANTMATRENPGDLPDGQIPDLPIESDLQKYLASCLTQIKSRTRIVPHPSGALRYFMMAGRRRFAPDNSVLVGDGQKALFLCNKGNPHKVDLVAERILERDNPPTLEQGTDRPG